MNKTAPYTIKLDDRREYLYAFVSGEILTPEIAKQYWDEIANKAFEIRQTKIMIEKDFAQSVSAAEMLEMGTYLGGILSTKKIAFLDRHGNVAINNLGQKIALNRGVNMKVFENIEDAEEWLKAS